MYSCQRRGSRLLPLMEKKEFGTGALGNIAKTQKEHAEAVGKILGMHLSFYDDAVDVYGNPLPDCYRMECSKEDAENNMYMDLFINTGIALSRRYEAKLRSLGFPVDDLDDTQTIYLGCEKVYWPELADRFMKEGRI